MFRCRAAFAARQTIDRGVCDLPGYHPLLCALVTTQDRQAMADVSAHGFFYAPDDLSTSWCGPADSTSTWGAHLSPR